MSKTPNDYPLFLGSEIEQSAMGDAAFSVLPVPYEKTVSYGGGTAAGPRAILDASWQLETWDGKSNPSAQGIHTCEAIDCEGTDTDIIEAIALATASIVRANSMPVVLGGEHTVTWGVVKGLLAAGVSDFGIVQIDAHADLRDAYEGNPLSHASVMRRVVDAGVPLFQLGVRAFCEEEMATREQFNVRYRDAEDIVPTQVGSIELPEYRAACPGTKHYSFSSR